MRIFLAISPPEEVKQRVWDVTAPLRETTTDVGWVPKPKIHLTLKFIGKMADERIEPLISAMAAIARTHAAPVVHLETVGAFPNFRKPRVIWMGIDQEPRLELLHHDVEVACDALGHELEGRAYRPHLTLGRVGNAVGADEAKVLRTAARRIRFTDQFFARSIDVVQSVPGPGGSKYSILASAPLRGS